MTLALVGAKRQLGVAPEQLRVGKPHGAEGGYDPHSAYKDLNDDNFFGYLCGKILDPEVATEWVSGEGGGWCVTRHQMSRRLRRHRACVACPTVAVQRWNGVARIVVVLRVLCVSAAMRRCRNRY